MTVTDALTIQYYHDIALIIVERDRVTDPQLIAQIGDGFQAAVDRYERPSVVLDLSKVTAMSSQMLGKMVAVHKSVKKAKGRFAVCAVNPSLKPLFKITKLEKLFDFYDTVREVMVLYQRKKA